jgi:hypothetical protein
MQIMPIPLFGGWAMMYNRGRDRICSNVQLGGPWNHCRRLQRCQGPGNDKEATHRKLDLKQEARFVRPNYVPQDKGQENLNS